MSNTKRKSKWMGFWVFCLIFALLVSGVTVFVLQKIEAALIDLEAQNTAKNNARPELARDAYLEALDSDHVAQQLEALYAQVDSRVQSREQCQAVVKEALQEGIGYKVSFTSSEKQSFVLYNMASEDGKHRQIGEFSITPQGESSYGYTPWSLAQESFNMDYLLCEGMTVTVPQGYSVWVNGNLLGDDCILEQGIGYEELREMPKDLPLPTKVTYASGRTLGAVTLEVRSPQGETVTIDENTDWGQFLYGGTQEQQAAVKNFVEEFLGHYVHFSSTSENIRNNYKKVISYVVPDGDLQKRLYNAMDGLQWVTSTPDDLLNITINRILALSDGRYVCDITYLVNVNGRHGTDEQSTNVFIVITQIKGEQKVESVTVY